MSPPSDNARVALVTGANRGIGFEIARQLGQKGLSVVLTARDAERGEAACRKLAGEGLAVAFEPLDVNDPESIVRSVANIRERFGRLDVLVNNAAISIDPANSLLEIELPVIEATMRTNFYGPLLLAKACVPLMQENDYGRIVNVSSGQGSFSKLQALNPSYRISKTALNALTVVLADELKETNIAVNAMTPGWVKTRLAGFNAPRTTAEGADTAVWLATLPDAEPRGQFFKDREPFPW